MPAGYEYIGAWNKKYRVREDVFDNIDCPEKAYWLGFIAADGGVEDCGYYRLFISLGKKDRSHLERFRSFMESDVPIRPVENSYVIRISRKHVVKALGKYGIVPNKTRTLTISGIPNEYYSDFIRGYFDGDGCLSKYGKGDRRIGITSGSPNIVLWIQSELMKNCGLRRTKIQTRDRDSGFGYDMVYSGNLQVERIMNFLNQHDGPRLDRKHLDGGV